jgi:hypothetical protein
VRELLRAPRFEIATARVEAQCGARAAAARRLEPLSRRSQDRSVADTANAYAAAMLTGRVDPAAWRAPLGAAERRAAELAEAGAGSPGLLALTRGRLLRALGREHDAIAQFRAVFLLPDSGLSHYLARDALRDRGPRRAHGAQTRDVSRAPAR